MNIACCGIHLERAHLMYQNKTYIYNSINMLEVIDFLSKYLTYPQRKLTRMSMRKYIKEISLNFIKRGSQRM